MKYIQSLKCCFYYLLVAVFFVQCGSSTTAHRSIENDTPTDIAEAKIIGKKMYEQLLTKDAAVIKKCFDKSIAADVESFIEILVDRDSTWGKFISFSVREASTTVIKDSKGDTTTYYITFKALYELNESWDVLTVQQTGKTGFKIIGYDFSQQFMWNCGSNELALLKPVYNDYTLALVNNDSATIRTMCGDDDVFYKEIMKLQEEFFPAGTVLDSITYNDGYMRKYCGTQGEANGIIVYTVYYNDSVYIDIMYKIEKEFDDEEYTVYSIYLSDELDVNVDTDVELAKTISKDVCKIISRNDANAFFNTFHTDLKKLYTTETKKDIVGIVDDFKNLGTFKDFYDYRTFHTKNNAFVYFIVVVELADADENSNYIEFVFKPDTNGKYMLMSCHELYD